MAERPSGKMLTANELLLQKLKETFDRNENVAVDSNGTNVWVMLAAAEPFSDLLEKNLPYPLSGQKPTHRIRVVLRTTDAQTGTNPYVDALTSSSLSTSSVRKQTSFGRKKASPKLPRSTAEMSPVPSFGPKSWASRSTSSTKTLS